MDARLKGDYRWNSARLCGGMEFVKSEFRTVPAGREQEAEQSGVLEFAADVVATPDPAPAPAPAPKPDKPAPKTGTNRRR